MSCSRPKKLRRLPPVVVLFFSTWAAVAAILQAAPPAADQPALKGLTLENALGVLEEAGLDLIFSSRVVRPTMVVTEEPTGDSVVLILAEILADHGLIYRVSGSRLIVVRDESPATGGVLGVVRDRWTLAPLTGAQVSVPVLGREARANANGDFELASLRRGRYELLVEAPGYPSQTIAVRVGRRITRLVIDLEVPVAALEMIVVTPSYVSLARSEPDTVFSLDREQVLRQPTPADDIFRAASTLPGTATNDLAADFSLRGGRADEVLVILDGLEIYEPYHLKDLGNALSAVQPQILESMQLTVSSFPAAFGDRMGGILDLRTRTSKAPIAGHAGLGPTDASLGLRGLTAGGRGSWLMAGRKGLIGEVLERLDREEDPHFYDFFGKGQLQLGDHQTLGLRLLRAVDDFNFDEQFEAPAEFAENVSEDRNTYFWATHEKVFGSHLLVSTRAHTGQIDGARLGTERSGRAVYDLEDRRRVGQLGLQQDWGSQRVPHRSWKWGFAGREIETRYEYSSELERFDPLSLVRTLSPATAIDFKEQLDGRQTSAYTSFRGRPLDGLTVEAGLRYDDNRLVNDRHYSPRMSAALAVRERGILRVSWGHYYQSQRPHELEVADGETRFLRDERSVQVVAGYEHFLPKNLLLRAEVYQRDISHPRPRYENLFDPFSIVPELEADRIRIDADSAKSEGIELFLRRPMKRFGWRLGYTLARVRDRIEGAKVARAVDQRHALVGNFDWLPNNRWSFSINADLHTGRPTTAVELGSNQLGEPLLLFGPHRAERLPDYARFDVRIARAFETDRGTLSLYSDLLNLGARRNVRGYDIDIAENPDGAELEREARSWGRLVPIVGVRFEF